MRVLITMVLLTFSSILLKAQDITDFFCLMPENYCFSLTAESRREMISNYQKGITGNETNMIRIKSLDIPNGYISLEGAFEGYWEMCFWNVIGGEKLICFCETGCGPKCSNTNLIFYHYDSGKLIPLDQRPMPELQLFRFFKDDVQVKDIERFYQESPTFTFQLPRVGMNITCSYEWVLGFEESEVKSLMKGDKMDINWVNGYFTLGEVHW